MFPDRFSAPPAAGGGGGREHATDAARMKHSSLRPQNKPLPQLASYYFSSGELLNWPNQNKRHTIGYCQFHFDV